MRKQRCVAQIAVMRREMLTRWQTKVRQNEINRERHNGNGTRCGGAIMPEAQARQGGAGQVRAGERIAWQRCPLMSAVNR